MRPELVAGVEALTGRRVIAFMSDNHVDPDVAVETFVLVPREREALQVAHSALWVSTTPTCRPDRARTEAPRGTTLARFRRGVVMAIRDFFSGEFSVSVVPPGRDEITVVPAGELDLTTVEH